MTALNQTPSGERLHISIFGRRNSGKSSLINALTSQKLAIVSEVPGTTTDPVSKAMEILPIGPVVVTDTAGIDDVGALGELRVERALIGCDLQSHSKKNNEDLQSEIRNPKSKTPDRSLLPPHCSLLIAHCSSLIAFPARRGG